MNLEKWRVPIEKLRLTIDPNSLGFNSTEEITFCEEIVGQDRAVAALRMGLEIESIGYNIYVTGPVGTGRTTTVKCLLDEIEKGKRIPDDKLYVNNFKDPDSPRLIRLPAGQGREFKKDMEDFIEHLQKNIPAVFESEGYQRRRNLLVEAFKEWSSKKTVEFEKKLEKEGFAIVQPNPFVKPEIVYKFGENLVKITDLLYAAEEGKITEEEYERIRDRHRELTEELNNIFKALKEKEKETREKLINLDKEEIKPLLVDQIKEMKEKYQNEKISIYLDEVEESILNNLSLFREKKEESGFPPTDPFLDYRVNLLVDNAEEKGAPVIFETSPTYKNLFGVIERVWDARGQWRTDFTKIKAGSLVKADGGYLVLNALDTLIEPGVWNTLKRTLRNRKVEIQNYDLYSLFYYSALKPEPIDIDLKVIMIGDPILYSLLATYDEDFKKVFKVRADFDWQMPYSEKTVKEYIKVIKSIITKENLLPFDNTGVGEVINFSIRLAGRRNKLSARFNIIADILKEASYWAKKEGKEMVSSSQVKKAIDHRRFRSRLLEEKIQDMIDEGTLLIDTEGKVVGQINGLSIFDTGEYAFGRPTRITARTAVGTQGVIDIEREAELSGKIHSKGVLILSGYLRYKYAQEHPLIMSASICFEQSYSGVEGDSASSAELCCLLSALSGLPLRQDIAITGSVNQKGEIQPIGGVNEKIEGFFEVCQKRGLKGTEGVIIPERNVEDLMLREEVIDACAQGLFHIYAVKTIEEAIEILTGLPAGEKDEKGNYPEGSVNYLVAKRLKEYALKYKEFAREEKSS
jgi:lon-related putative ATP-dependent protease|uniref:endopeptidase La n=1 Tax=candidate division WOR-3 bacterium TaxID=2052148 RepID=A0A7C3Z2T1_UNCW3